MTEYEKKKIEPEIKSSEEKAEAPVKPEVQELQKKSSEKALVISVAAIVLLLAALFAFNYIHKPQQPLTLEDMHALNLNGKLNPNQGYVYKNVYSFVTQGQEWFTQLSSPKGTKIYDLALRYSPRDLKNITIEGNLNTGFFDNQSEYYVTFNPKGSQFSYIGLAVADFNTHMSKVFEKTPIGACDRNETFACQNRPIVTCENSTKLVIYIRESDRLRAYYKDNCIVIEGSGLDIVKGVDRVLYNLYRIMGKEAE